MKTKKQSIKQVVRLEDAETKILSAKMIFGTNHAWFGSLIGKVQFQVTTNKRFSTCATDGRTIFFGYDFIMKHTVQEIVFVIGHELLHCLLNHHIRKTNTRDSQLWNAACDYVVNDILLNNSVGDMPEGALYDYKYKGKTVEEIYNLLDKLSEKKKKQLATLDDHSLIEGDDSEDLDDNDENNTNGMSEEVAEDWNDILEQALRSRGGNGEGTIEESLRQVCTPSRTASSGQAKSLVDWKEELSMFIKSKFQSDLTYLKPLKKTQALGFVLPSIRMDERLNLAIALDTSGSIDLAQLRIFLAEVTEILSSYESFIIHLWCFDTEIHNYKILESSELRSIEDYQLKGGGGTNFEVNWELIEDKNIKPDLLLMLTDGQPCVSWGDENSVDTLFAIVGDSARRTDAPFGSTIYLD